MSCERSPQLPARIILFRSLSIALTARISHVIFFPTVAAISLFTNILVHPEEEDTLVDAHLLATTPDIMRNIPLRAPTTCEIEFIRQMIEFVTELAHLGEYAVSKARSGVQRATLRGD